MTTVDSVMAPAGWAVMAFGSVQKMVVRADVADESACKWRESDPEATAVPLFTWAAVEAMEQQARVQALRDAAAVCEEHAADKEPPHKDYENTYLDGWLDASNECGWAILAMIPATEGAKVA